MLSPTIKGIGSVIEFDAGNGTFLMAHSGSRQEDFSNGLYYYDGKHEFCFYLTAKFNPETKSTQSIDIYKACAYERFHGPAPIINSDDLYEVELNITSALRNRHYFNLKQETDVRKPHPEIAFSWKLRE